MASVPGWGMRRARGGRPAGRRGTAFPTVDELVLPSDQPGGSDDVTGCPRSWWVSVSVSLPGIGSGSMPLAVVVFTMGLVFGRTALTTTSTVAPAPFESDPRAQPTVPSLGSTP